LQRAVASVLDQSYRRVEVVVVDDATSDGTAEWLGSLDDDRVRVVRNDERRGEGAARNAALGVVTGEVVTFLDDDNEFDPDWLRSVAWLFQEHPDTWVAYGARVVDDVERHHGRAGRGLPWFQLNEWDRDLNRERCLVDVNVLAHRRTDIRFDPDLVIFTDWDYLLGLTSDVDPVRLPVVATYYSTSAADRATDVARAREPEMYARVRARWADGG
jgi:glycosyltransferase involved in cell wall biosynthesis